MKIAIITGASSGIGREFALQLYKRGEVDYFWLIARRESRLNALKEELGGKAQVISCDLTQKEGVDKIKTLLEEQKPEVEYLINGSGFGKFGYFDEIKEEEVSSMIDLNVKALVLITHAVIPYMKRGGKIIQIASSSAFTPLPAFNVYASSKAFVLHYTKALKYEIKPYGITATAFCPCWVNTEFVSVAEKEEGARPKKIYPLLEVRKVVKKAIKDAKRGKTLSVTNWFAKFQHLSYKLLPDCILSKIWVGMLNDKRK